MATRVRSQSVAGSKRIHATASTTATRVVGHTVLGGCGHESVAWHKCICMSTSCTTATHAPTTATSICLIYVRCTVLSRRGHQAIAGHYLSSSSYSNVNSRWLPLLLLWFSLLLLWLLLQVLLLLLFVAWSVAMTQPPSMLA